MFRLDCESSFTEVVVSARVAFSRRSWPFVVCSALSWVVLTGQRTVTRVAALASHPRSLSSYYRFLSSGKFRLEVFFRCLFEVIVATFRPAEVTIVLDDTLSPKWGRGIFGTAYHFDHAARPRPGYIWGHSWVVLAIVLQIGEMAYVALPFWVSLYRPRKRCPAREFRTRHELAVHALECVRSWVPDAITLTLIADGAYNVRPLIGAARALDTRLVSRIRSDARLREVEPPPRRKGARGRKPKHGAYLAALPAIARQKASFASHTVAIYGRKVTLLLREVVAYWPAARCVVKIVIARDPGRKRRAAYLCTTDVAMSAVAVVETFARRWTIEQLFSVVKLKLGFDSAEVRKEHSVVRHAALTMALVTWVEVWARRVRPRLAASPFSAKIAAVREDAVKKVVFASGPKTRGLRRNAETLARLFTVMGEA